MCCIYLFAKLLPGIKFKSIQTSKYVIGVMWCLSNMWTVFFVKKQPKEEEEEE